LHRGAEVEARLLCIAVNPEVFAVGEIDACIAGVRGIDDVTVLIQHPHRMHKRHLPDLLLKQVTCGRDIERSGQLGAGQFHASELEGLIGGLKRAGGLFLDDLR
jgi:hypothetical protein